MDYFLAIFPILIVLGLMLIFKWGGQRAGPVAWLAGLLVAGLAFGLTWNVCWVSQAKGLLLSINVLAVMWSALFLYYMVDQMDGIQAIAAWLKGQIADRGLLLLVLAWVFSSLVEGVAGFGLPMAIVAPLLVALGLSPLVAVAATAIGHSWAVTLGNMGLVFNVLVSVVQMDSADLAPAVALLMGFACLACGMGTAVLLKQLRLWKEVLLISTCMAAVQYLLTVSGLAPLGSFSAAAAGAACAIWLGKKGRSSIPAAESKKDALRAALLGYGIVVGLMITANLILPLQAALSKIVWQINFPEVATLTGFVTPAGPGQVFRPLLHPGVIIMTGSLIAYLIFRRKGYCPAGMWRTAAAATVHSAGTATIGVLAMVGLSTLMEHSGMTMLLARGLSQTMGATFPLVSPLVGMLGAFATGSNNNSNVLFAPLQKNAALLLGIPPALLIAAQTVGGSLGSMVAPAKIMVGCSTTGMKGRNGEVLRYTLPAGILLGLLMGLVTWILVQMSR